MRIVIGGAGDVGTYLAQHFSSLDHEVVLIDQSADALTRIEESMDVGTLNGNITFRQDLERAHVKGCDIYVSVTGNDDVNIVSSGLVKELGVGRTVARVDAPSFYKNPRGVEKNVLGISALLCASRLVSSELKRMFRKLDWEFLENFALNSIAVGVVEVADGFRHFEKNSAEIELGKNVQLVGVIRSGDYRPAVEITKLFEGDRLVIAGATNSFGAALKRISDHFSGRRVVIVGGGDVGFQLAQGLRGEVNKITLIDVNKSRCQILSERLDDVTIVHGDGTNISFLQDEHVESADCMISVTRADEVNLMSSLLGKELGVKSTFALVHRPGYGAVYNRLGVTETASSHELVGTHVAMLTTNDWIISQKELPNSKHLIAEVHVPETWQSKDIRLGDLAWPLGCQLLAISHHETYSQPEPQIRLQDDAHLIFAVEKGKANDLNKYLKHLFGSY